MYDLETKAPEMEINQLKPFNSYSFFMKRKGDASFTASVDTKTTGLGKTIYQIECDWLMKILFP